MWNAVTSGKFSADMRYRFENVDQAGKSNDANASTLRTRFGYRTGGYHGLSLLLEGVNVTVLGLHDYNDTVNNRTAFPVVADPPLTQVNQAYLQYRGPLNTRLRTGRQRIKLDNDRWIGNVGFRQNEQTFDALSVVSGALPATTLTYAYLWRVNRIFGVDSPKGVLHTDAQVIHGAWRGLPDATLVGYAYLLEFDNAPALSSATYGARLTGRLPVAGVRLLYTAEYARQSDYGNSPTSFGLDYFLGTGGVAYGPFFLKAGYEILGGNGTHSVQTPLATLHAFDGWADVFLTTPAAGLRDLRLHAGAAYLGAHLDAVFHRFTPDDGAPAFGNEWDLQLKRTFTRHYTLGLTYADYHANEPGTGTFNHDTRKLWIWAQMHFTSL